MLDQTAAVVNLQFGWGIRSDIANLDMHPQAGVAVIGPENKGTVTTDMSTEAVCLPRRDRSYVGLVLVSSSALLLAVC